VSEEGEEPTGHSSELAAGADLEVFSFGPFRLLPARRLLERSGERVKVGGRAFDILVLLVSRAGEVVTQREVHAVVWAGLIVDDGSLRFHVSALRKALLEREPDVTYVVNVPGRGYSFVAPVMRQRVPRPATGPVVAPKGNSGGLPPPLARMVGRDDSIREATDKLLAQRFVTIVGPGGMGKTTVAVALAHAVRADFKDAVHFVDLASVRDPGQVASAVAVATGVQVFTEDPLPSIVAVLSRRHALLILDSCEHVLDAVTPVVEAIFRLARNVCILATSRQPLNVEGEHIFRLPPLRMPPVGVSVTAQEMAEYPAPQLFMERARASGAPFDPTDADVATIVAICRRLDGMALAIELAAGRVQAYGIRKTAELLGQQFTLLWPGRRTALPRHQTLTATLDWSYNLLSPAERRLLYRLAVFIGAFDSEAVEAVVHVEGETADHPGSANVPGLVAKSLVVDEVDGTASVSSRASTRYRLLDTTRLYALQKAAEAGETRELSYRHARYYERILIRHAHADRSAGEWPYSLASNLNDLRAALNWAFSEAGDTSLGVRLTAYSASFWLGLGLLPECRDRMARAVQRIEASDATSEEQVLVQMALAAAVMFTVGLGEEFRTSWNKVLSLAEGLADLPRQLTAYLALWAQQIRTADSVEAQLLADRCAAVAEKTGAAGPKAMATWMLGLCAQQKGHNELARRLLETALATDDDEDRHAQLRHFGHDRRTDALSVLSTVLLMQGDAAAALETSGAAIAEAREVHYPVPFCIALSWHSLNLYLVGAEWTEIDRQAGRLADYAQRRGIEAYQGLGVCLQALAGNPASSPRQVAEKVIAGTQMLTRGQYGVFNPIFRTEAAMTLMAAGLLLEAKNLFAMAEDEDRQTDNWARPEIMRVKGEILNAQGKSAEAEGWFNRAIQLAIHQGAVAWQLRAANSLARLWASQGRGSMVDGLLGPLLPAFQGGVLTRDYQEAAALIDSSNNL
jgi:predicted ATPase/DNA-binding winged helix-turn-helix (wHTH) protein